MYDAETKAQRRQQDIKGLSRMLTQRLRKSKTTTASTPLPPCLALLLHPAGYSCSPLCNAMQLPVWPEGFGLSGNATYASPKSSCAGFLLPATRSLLPAPLQLSLWSHKRTCRRAEIGEATRHYGTGVAGLGGGWLCFLAHVKMLVIKIKSGSCIRKSTTECSMASKRSHLLYLTSINESTFTVYQGRTKA